MAPSGALEESIVLSSRWWCYDRASMKTTEGNKEGKTTKADLVEAIQAKGTMTQKETKELIDALFEEIKTAILGGKIVRAPRVRDLRGEDEERTEAREEPEDGRDRHRRGSWPGFLPAGPRAEAGGMDREDHFTKTDPIDGRRSVRVARDGDAQSGQILETVLGIDIACLEL